jgi:hypothetical protein
VRERDESNENEPKPSDLRQALADHDQTALHGGGRDSDQEKTGTTVPEDIGSGGHRRERVGDVRQVHRGGKSRTQAH